MERKSQRKGVFKFQHGGTGALIAVVLLIFSATGIVSEPAPVDARTVACPISGASTLPTKVELTNLIDPDEAGVGARGGRWVTWAQLSPRCKSLLGKGHYLYRAAWTVELQLKSGWPDGIDYQQYNDARFETRISSLRKDAALVNGFTANNNYGTPWSYSGASAMATSGRSQSFLTELCFSERCKFSVEETGTYASVSGDDMLAVSTHIDLCFRYIPQGAEGLAETVKCRNGFGGRDYYAHPGTFGMQVRISGTMTFEPIWTWRR